MTGRDTTDDPLDSMHFNDAGQLVHTGDRAFFGKPPAAADPVHVTDVAPPLLGRRLIWMTKEGPVYDHVAASEVWIDDAGSWIRVVEDWRWHTYNNTPKRTPRCPHAVAHPTLNIWVER